MAAADNAPPSQTARYANARIRRLLAQPFADVLLPVQTYGAPGDRELWGELLRDLRGEPVPPDGDATVALVAARFKKLTGRPLTTTDPFTVDRYTRGGTINGTVCPVWWRDVALPLLADRANAYHSDIDRFRDALAEVLQNPVRPRKLPANGVTEFIHAAAQLLAHAAADRRTDAEWYPDGERERIDSAASALVKLGKDLRRLTPVSRHRLLYEGAINPEAATALEALAAGDGLASPVVLEAVAQLLMAAGEHQATLRKLHRAGREGTADGAAKRRVKVTTARAAYFLVQDLACAWREYLVREPGVEKGSVFPDVALRAWRELTGAQTLDRRTLRKAIQGGR